MQTDTHRQWSLSLMSLPVWRERQGERERERERETGGRDRGKVISHLTLKNSCSMVMAAECVLLQG